MFVCLNLFDIISYHGTNFNCFVLFIHCSCRHIKKILCIFVPFQNMSHYIIKNKVKIRICICINDIYYLFILGSGSTDLIISRRTLFEKMKESGRVKMEDKVSYMK